MGKIELFMNKFLLLLLLTLHLYAGENLKTFNVAYMTDSMSNYSKKDLEISMNLWLKEISKKAGYDANMFFYDDPRDAVTALEEGKIDYVSGFPLVFVKYFDLSKLSDAFSGGPDDLSDNLFVVLVSQDIKSWSELKEKRIGIQKNDDIMCMYIRLKLNDDKANIENYDRRSKVVLDLFFDKIDVAVVPLKNFLVAKELNPQIGQKIKILEKTNINATNLSFYRKDLDDAIKKEVYEEAKRIYASETGHQMMLIYKANRIIYTHLEDLKPVEDLYKKYLEFKRKKNQK